MDAEPDWAPRSTPKLDGFLTWLARALPTGLGSEAASGFAWQGPNGGLWECSETACLGVAGLTPSSGSQLGPRSPFTWAHTPASHPFTIPHMESAQWRWRAEHSEYIYTVRAALPLPPIPPTLPHGSHAHTLARPPSHNPITRMNTRREELLTAHSTQEAHTLVHPTPPTHICVHMHTCTHAHINKGVAASPSRACPPVKTCSRVYILRAAPSLYTHVYMPAHTHLHTKNTHLYP